MADPGTLALISIGTSAAGAITGAIGSAQAGAASANMYRYQAGVAKINENVAKQNAAWTRAAGEVSAQRYGMKSSQERGQIVTAQAASGTDITSGSNLRVQESHDEIVQHDLAMIRSNAAHKAFGYDIEATSKEAEGKMFEMAASKSRTAGALGIASSLIGGASSVSSKWMQYKNMFGEDPKSSTGTIEPIEG